MYIVGVYFIYITFTNMKTTQTVGNWSFILRNNELTVRAMFNNWKIWLTINEIAYIYKVEKSEAKKEINNILINSNLDLSNNIQKIHNSKSDELETFYSLDVLLLLWYRSKHFTETKFLVNSNKILREYTISRQYRTAKPKTIFSKIFSYFSKTV